LQIPHGGEHAFKIITELPDATVAGVTQQPAHLASSVVVIDV
jgi:hypothetical protein